jgi:L-seryl-tRNA(Ser) seleniumtransferase
VDRLLAREPVERWVEEWGREVVVDALRGVLSAARQEIGSGERPGAPPEEELVERARARLREGARPSLRRVLNATGVVLHTNLGRAPLAREARSAMEGIAAGYSNLEYELEAGRRGSRYHHCADLLRELTGAPAALVVNNNAAAVSLAVNELAGGGEVVISRGEMVEIGGSFRIPDVVRRSGGVLRGVGTTNRTRIGDYREAVGEETGLLMKVHPANYRVEGFSERVPVEELVALGREVGVPVVHDVGSGLLAPELLDGFPPEPAPADSIRAGADLVTWSGDKLLGGPQAGVLLGSEEMVDRVRGNPLLRAFRVDKITLAALEATLRLYRDPERAAARIPALRMLREPAGDVRRRAEEALSRAREGDRLPVPPARVRVREMDAMVGGGSFPAHRVPSAGWAVDGVPAEALDRRCRAADPPLVGRIREGELLLDFRTLRDEEQDEVGRVLARALRDPGGDAGSRHGP